MSSASRQRFNRFPPIEDVEWLDHNQRKNHRNTIQTLTDLALTLEQGAEISPEQEAIIRTLTAGSEARDTRLNAAWDLLERTETTYYGKLAAMAPHDLTAYHELLNPHEPPAQHHRFVCEHLMKVERGDIRTLIIALPPGAAKALTLDTPVPTPTGWTTMGDLRVGDEVLDEDGNPCRVTWKSPVWRDRPVYRVATDCGDEIMADADHEWPVQLCRKHPHVAIVETHELARKRSKRPMIRRAEALNLPEIALPLDPYLLGFWLGDGNSSGPRVTCSLEDAKFVRAEIERRGYETNDQNTALNFYIPGVRHILNSLGLLNDPHHNTVGRKHIPRAYLRASYSQRLDLLRGLVDSDGTVNARGETTFSNTNYELARAVQELVRSLGVKATMTEGRAKVNGKDCGVYYRVRFYMKGSALLPRKANKTRDAYRTINTYIDTTFAGFADTVCIEVDSPSHLFLCGESMTPTHNSTYSSRTFAQWVLGRNPDWRVLAVGHSQKFVEDEFSKPNRTAIDSDIFRMAFPDVMLNPAEKSASFWRLDGWRGSYACRGALAGTSGLRAKIVLADDLFKNAQDAMSAVVRENIWRWWTADVMSRRLPNAPTVLVNCLTAETPVLRADGSWTPISELKVGDDLWTYDKETGEPSVQVVEHWAEQPEDKIYEVHTGNGMVRCNGKHPFWARKYRYKGKWDDPCWINAEDLCVSDKVLHGGQREGSSEARLTEDEAWVLGLFFGDGCVSTGKGRAPWFCDQYITRLSVSNKPDDQQYIQQRINATFGIEFRFVEQKMTGGTSARFETNTVRTAKWLDARGIKIAGSAHTKRVPEWMFDQPRVIRQAFVDGLIHADGHRASSGQLSITLCNEGLIRDLRTLLIGLGIKATTARRYEQCSTLPGREEKYHSVRYRVTYRDGNTYNDAFYWKGVTKVVDTKAREKVYDIQVSKTHNFVADHIVVSNTLWHSEDVPNRLKRMYEDNPDAIPQPFEFINIPAQAGMDDPLGREEGEWLWCIDQQEDGFYHITDYISKRDSTTPALWSALYQGEPLDKQGDYIAEDQFQRYDKPPINKQGRPQEWTKTVMSIDCAAKGKERSDYTAILVFRIGVDGHHYLVDVWRKKETMENVVRSMARLMRMWQVNHAIIEDSGMGAQIIENYAMKMPSPLIPYVPAGKGSKDFRFDAAAAWITSGRILFPKNAPWIIDFINELIAFPNGANDDQVDAFSQYTANELKLRIGGTKPLRMRL